MTSGVAGIWVEGNDNISAYKRSIVVYGRSDYSQYIKSYFSCYDPLSYPLFFPNGEPGWHSNIQRHGACINQIVNDEENIEEDLEETNDFYYESVMEMKKRWTKSLFAYLMT
ncbi:hypothetical protein L6452_25793 [Arctium lappa]|uniref:Uncharacterized protein n=1 Tax=Arctium lappa TaxID=4217 RepID=A0ACB9ACV1_ARCLA|nr:hypothetical protein L6452_25793 [Arctium lappa]